MMVPPFFHLLSELLTFLTQCPTLPLLSFVSSFAFALRQYPFSTLACLKPNTAKTFLFLPLLGEVDEDVERIADPRKYEMPVLRTKLLPAGVPYEVLHRDHRQYECKYICFST